MKQIFLTFTATILAGQFALANIQPLTGQQINDTYSIQASTAAKSKSIDNKFASSLHKLKVLLKMPLVNGQGDSTQAKINDIYSNGANFDNISRAADSYILGQIGSVQNRIMARIMGPVVFDDSITETRLLYLTNSGPSKSLNQMATYLSARYKSSTALQIEGISRTTDHQLAAHLNKLVHLTNFLENTSNLPK